MGKGIEAPKVALEDWIGCSRPDLSRLAMDPAIGPHPTRLMLAAMGRVDYWGHARFSPGELGHILARVCEGGELIPASSSNVSKAIRQAKARGLVGSDSKARCLTLPHWLAQYGKRGKKGCPIHA